MYHDQQKSNLSPLSKVNEEEVMELTVEEIRVILEALAEKYSPDKGFIGYIGEISNLQAKLSMMLEAVNK